MDYQVHKTTNPYLDRVRSHKEPYTTEVLGTEIIIYPNVMSPKYDWSSRFHIENMPTQKDKDYLEIGCGSGVISLFAALQGAKKIVAVDINPNAIMNTIANFEKYNLKNADIFYSDVFENVRGTFDTITFAAPYHGNEPKDILEYGVSDPDYRALRLFLEGAKRFLKEKGQIILGFSDTGDVNLLYTLFIENKYLVTDVIKETNDWTAHLYILEPIKFENKKQEYIYDDDYFWFRKYKQEIISGNILKVGYGLGFTSYFIRLFNTEITNLDIRINSGALFKDQVGTYNGEIIPFHDNSFDTVICTYTLHHAHNPEMLFKELSRISRLKVIVVEETWQTILQKIQLIFYCWLTNKQAYQKVDIIFRSYLSTQLLLNLFKKNNLFIMKNDRIRRRRYLVELLIAQKRKYSGGREG